MKLFLAHLVFWSGLFLSVAAIASSFAESAPYRPQAALQHKAKLSVPVPEPRFRLGDSEQDIESDGSSDAVTHFVSQKVGGGSLLTISATSDQITAEPTAIEKDYLKFLEGGRYSRVQSISNGFALGRGYSISSSRTHSGAKRTSTTHSYRASTTPQRNSNFATIDNSQARHRHGRAISKRARNDFDSNSFAAIDNSSRGRYRSGVRGASRDFDSSEFATLTGKSRRRY